MRAKPLSGPMLVSAGVCATVVKANMKVEAFREWREALPLEKQDQLILWRDEIIDRGLPNMGEKGADELIASLFLKLGKVNDEQ